MNETLQFAVDKIGNLGVEGLDGVISTGSGQSMEFSGLEKIAEISYSEIPGMAGESIYGQEGVLRIFKNKFGKYWAVFIGRKHFYQGYGYREIGFYIDVSHALGASRLVCLNAAGGLDPSLTVGEILVARKFKCFVPLEGIPIPLDGTPWRETSAGLVDSIISSAIDVGIALKRSNYVGVPGPTYETAADVNWLRKLGATVVGMSTVPELMRALELSMQTTCVSVIANVHGGGKVLTHEEVVDSSRKANNNLARVIENFIS